MFWPPNDGNSTVGTKTLHRQYNGNIVIETLNDLHKPAWWSGVRVSISTPTRRISDLQVHVSLLKSDNTPAIDLGVCDWIQTTDTWKKFPWAIPAAMATALNLRLEVRVIDDNILESINEPLYITVKTCFHEMPHLPPRDKYLFINDVGRLLHQWNGVQHVDGTPFREYPPVWRTVHRVVAPMWMWDETAVFCVHDWNEIVPV